MSASTGGSPSNPVADELAVVCSSALQHLQAQSVRCVVNSGALRRVNTLRIRVRERVYCRNALSRILRRHRHGSAERRGDRP